MTSKRTYLTKAKIKRNESLKMYVDSVEMTDAVHLSTATGVLHQANERSMGLNV